VNVIAPIMTSKQGFFLQPTYFPIVEYGKQRGNTSLDVWVSGPTYTIGDRPALQYLDVSATWNPKTRDLFLNVLNRSKDRDLEARIENEEGNLAPQAALWELNHPELKATHTFGDDKKIRPVTRDVSLSVKNGGFSHTFPAHSLTILRIRLSG
jgi:alpha-L-arabinofuranosidase